MLVEEEKVEHAEVITCSDKFYQVTPKSYSCYRRRQSTHPLAILASAVMHECQQWRGIHAFVKLGKSLPVTLAIYSTHTHYNTR